MTGVTLWLQTSALPPVQGSAVVSTMLAYLAIVAAIGWAAARRTRGADDFFVAGRGLGLVTMTCAAMAANISGFAFIGGPALVTRIGVGALFILLPLAYSTVLSTWVVGRRLRLLTETRPLLTIPDAIGARYRSPAAQRWAGVAILLAVIGYLATNLLALGLVLDAVFRVGLPLAVVTGAVLVLAYSASGGIKAGVWTDVFQGGVMALASLLVFVQVLRVGGGWTNIMDTVQRHDATLVAPFGTITPLAALSFFLVFGVGALGQPHVMHKFYMLREVRALRWYPLTLTVAMSVTLLLFVGIGFLMSAQVLSGALPPLARADDATPLFVLRYLSAPLGGLVLAGTAAAIMSSVNAFLSIGSAAIVHDIRARGERRRDLLRPGRIATLVLTVAATLLALLPGRMVAFLGIFGWGLFASTLVPSLALGLNWKGATRQGAMASIGTGLIVTLGLETLAWFRWFTVPAGITATAVALVASLAVFLLVSTWTGESAAGQIDPDVALIMEL